MICLFGASKVVKSNHKEKYVYSGFGITFDSAGSLSFIMTLPEML